MTERREIKEDARHALHGPHLEPPTHFVPLRLFTERERVHIEVTRPVAVLGRHSGAELRFAFPEVSRRHCRFVFENAQWRVFDLDSLNGVILNGERVVEATLYAGDRLRCGCVRLLVESATSLQPVPGIRDKLRQIVDALPTKKSA